MLMPSERQAMQPETGQPSRVLCNWETRESSWSISGDCEDYCYLLVTV